MHRIYVEWEGGYYVTSLDPDFHNVLQKFVEDLGRPTKVEFRAENEGWYIPSWYAKDALSGKREKRDGN